MFAVWTFPESLDWKRVERVLDNLGSDFPCVWRAPDEGDDAPKGSYVLGFSLAVVEANGDLPPESDAEGLVWAPIYFGGVAQGGATLEIDSELDSGDDLEHTLLAAGSWLAEQLGAVGPPTDAAGDPLSDWEDDDDQAEADYRDAYIAAFGDYVVCSSLELGADERSRLEERWTHRQSLLNVLRLELGEENMAWSADLAHGVFRWERSDKTPLIVASTRPLLSWGASSESVRMGWALEDIPPEIAIPRVASLPDQVFEASESDAWSLAMRVGDAVGAHFLYRAARPMGVTVLGLWDVRRAAPDEQPMAVRSPWPFVARVLGILEDTAQNGGAVTALSFAWGSAFVADTVRKGSLFETPLREVGEKLLALSLAKNTESVAPAIRELRLRVTALQRS